MFFSLMMIAIGDGTGHFSMLDQFIHLVHILTFIILYTVAWMMYLRHVR